MKILVTGGAGFQGSHLVRHLLLQNCDVTILNTWSERAEQTIENFKDRVRIIWGSITDKEIVEKTVRDHDIVFHLAARINVDESIHQPLEYLEVNVKGTYHILEAVRRCGNRMIYASTCEVYGAPVGDIALSESSELRPHSPYAASKAAADRLCFSYYKTYGTNVTVVRPFNIYGEFQKEGAGGALIAIFVKKALDGQPLVVFGDGNQTRDYLHVSDLVHAYDIVFNRNDLAGETINFGSGKQISVQSIAQYIAKKFDVEVQNAESRHGEVSHFVCDGTKAKTLGFEPNVDIFEGIDRYIAWRQPLHKK